MTSPNLSNRPAVDLRNIRFSYTSGTNSFGLALDDLNISHGESVFLAGESGSGKSTLLGLLCGTLVPRSGSVKILGTQTNTLPGSRRDEFRANHFGIIFQMFNLLPYLTILDSILLPLKFSSLRRMTVLKGARSEKEEACRLLAALGVDPEEFGHQKAGSLSVGQQQRVAAARAFMGSPDIIIADEPTSSLDEAHQVRFVDLLFSEKSRTGASLIMVSHDMRLADQFDKVIQLQDICRVGKGAHIR